MSGVLSTSGVSRNGGSIRQRVLIVTPESVTVYCDSRGKPFLFLPIKGLGRNWPNKRSLAELSGVGKTTTSVLSTTDGGFPAMPDSMFSSEPVYCATIADAKAQYSATERVPVELQCRSLQNPSSGQFTLKEDGSGDTIPVYYTKSVQATDRINKIVGTIQKDSGSNYWIEVDSGPNWETGDFVGSVQSIPSGTIAWSKTFADLSTLPSSLSGKVVTRTFPSLDYFYIEETSRSSGIRVYDSGMASSVAIGDIVDVSGDMSSDDGERVIIASSTTITGYTTILSQGMNNQSLAGGSFNVLTPGAYNAFGLNNVGLFVRAWGKITEINYDGFYIDDGSNVTDGGTAAGIRVVGLGGYQPNTPAVDDYVAVTGISGLATYDTEYGLARTIRIASSDDLNVVQYAGPPAEVEVQPTGTDTNGYGKLTIYWKTAPGAIGYNIYRGTTSGGEDYQNPINGSTPWNTPSYTGSDKFAFTDTGLTFWQEYFYT